MNHLCKDCKFKYEPVDILDYYEKTGTVPSTDWMFSDLRSTFWLCQNTNNSPLNFSNEVVKLNLCSDFNSFGTCPNFMTNDAEGIVPVDFALAPIEEEIYIDDVVTATATPIPPSEGYIQLLNYSYQWYKNGRKLFKEKKQTITIDTKKEDTSYYHCVVTETMADNGDGGRKKITVTTNSIEIKVLPALVP